MDGGGEEIVDTFQYWRDALEAVRNNTALPPMRDGYPQCGYFRIRKIKDGPWIPVASYLQDGERMMLVDGYPILREDHNKTWLSCARHPVTYEDYDFRTANGHWPGTMAPPKEAAIGDNSGEVEPETADILLIRELDAAKAWIETVGQISSDELADEAANRVGELRKLRTLVEKIHETEKEPFLTACRAVDDKYLPLIRTDERKPGRATAAIKFLLSKITEWDTKKKAIADKKAADERAAHLKAMEEAAKASAQNSVAAQGGATTSAGSPETLPSAPPPPPPAAPVRSSYGGVSGRRVASTVKKVAVIVDQDACYQHFKDNPQVKAVLQTLANAMVKAKMPVPGVEEREEAGAI